MQSPQLPELIIRILCDTPPPFIPDAAFLFGQTEDNQESVLTAAVQLLSARLTPRVLFVQTGPLSGFPGFEAWQQKLQMAGIRNEQIEGIAGIDSPILHTLIEAEAMVRFAKEKGYQTLYIVSPPFHQVRAFMTAVTAALREFPELTLYSHPGVALPWQETVVHSQGSTWGTRSDLIHGELVRITKYHQQDDLASVEEVLAYLNGRDQK